MGAVAAIVATMLAMRSSRSASRSAEAAEKALELARAEADFVRSERERQPLVSVELAHRALAFSEVAPPSILVLDVRCKNSGQRSADVVIVNLVVPRLIKLEVAGDPDGTTAVVDPGPETGIGVLDDGRHTWSSRVGPIEPQATVVAYLRVVKPPPGRFPIELKISYDEGRRGTHRHWNLHIPESGQEIRLEDADAGDLNQA